MLGIQICTGKMSDRDSMREWQGGRENEWVRVRGEGRVYDTDSKHELQKKKKQKLFLKCTAIVWQATRNRLLQQFLYIITRFSIFNG